MSQARDTAMRRAVLLGVAIETPIVLGGVALGQATGDWGWALGAAGLGVVVLFVLIARAKAETSR